MRGFYEQQDFLMHHGILGQKWGIRRYQNKDGSLTDAGRKRYYPKMILGSLSPMSYIYATAANKDVRRYARQYNRNTKKYGADAEKHVDPKVAENYKYARAVADYIDTSLATDYEYRGLLLGYARRAKTVPISEAKASTDKNAKDFVYSNIRKARRITILRTAAASNTYT